MKKTTQFLTNVKVWQSLVFAFIFLFSLTIYSQIDAASAAVGDELTYNGLLQTTGDEGVTGSGTGCSPCGWNAMQGTNYAPTNNGNNNGACQSENRMFKTFATNGNNGSFVNQQITNLPAGTFTYAYWTKWSDTAGNLSYTDENGDTLEPKFTIRVLQADGTYSIVHEEVIPLTADQTWQETTGTWENTEAGATVRLVWYKRGGTGSAPTGMNKSMFVDTVSFTYTAAANTVTTESIPWSDDFESGLGNWTNTQASGAPTSIWEASTLANSTAGGTTSARHNYSSSGTYDSWLISPIFDLSGATTPVVNYSDYVDWSGDAVAHSLVYSEDYDGTNVDTATWVVLNSVIGTEDTWVENGPYTLPTSATVTIAFRYEGYYAAEWFVDDVSVAEAPTEPGMTVSATAGAFDSGTATVSITTDNFTVAATDGGGDGHWHYTLDGGSTVMVYDTNDITLTDLAPGEHTLFAWLVDNSHQALDPAVEQTVTWTNEGTPGCGESTTYTYGNNESGTLFTTTSAGQNVTVTVTGSTESGYDSLVITDGSGAELYNATGDHTGQAITSTDGTINVSIVSDGSVSGETLTFAVTCETASAAVTFTVNTANIAGGVGDNGMYLAGGVITDTFGGGAQAVAMTDADGDGTWEVTVDLPIGTSGNYIFLNSPSNDGDWGAKEVLTGQECADPSSYDDRILAEITGDVTLQHCFGSCETDGTCPAAGTFYDVTFTVNMASYDNAADLSSGVYLNGEFNGWCGDCNQMTDNGDGTYSIVMNLEEGDYRFKFTVGGWTDQEYFDGSESCTNTNDAGYTDRVITVDAEGIVYEVCFELCPGESCAPAAALELKGVIDFNVGGAGFGGNDGKGIHLVANSDISDLSIYGLGSANNGGGSDGQETTLEGSISAGQHMLIVRNADAMNAYADASNNWDIVWVDPEGGSGAANGNGNDAVELFENGAVIETFGDITFDGGSGNYDHDWAYTDSWAYKNDDGVWTYGGMNCSDGGQATTCESDCPYPHVTCDTSGNVIAFLGSGNWRVQAEEGGHMGVGPGTAYWAEWWNANPWDKAATGLYDDGWTFSSDGVMTHDTGDDGAIFGKKDAIDGAWPDNTPYDADNADGEYEYYTLADYTDTYTVDTTSGDYDTVTLGSNGTIGFHTATAAQEYQILETGDGYVYFRNVGFDGNSWYGKFTTADYLSTNDSQILDMRIYPNPVDGNYVTILSPVNGIKDIQIFDINGRMVMDTAINNNTLDVSSINSGFYMIKVTIDGQSKVSKLVVR